MWLGKEHPDSNINMFLVYNDKDCFLVKNARLADIIQATLNLVEVEDAELQAKVDDSSAEGDVIS